MERVMRYVKDMIESFDDYYPCTNNNCGLVHVYNWIKLFVYFYNDRIKNTISFMKGSGSILS